MPKARFFERWPRQGGWALALLLGCAGAASRLHAQTPSMQDVVESAKQAKLHEYNKSLGEAYKPVPLPGAAAPVAAGGRPAELPPVPALAPPVLRAIYGVNQLIEAELLFDGRSYSVYSDDERVDIGLWRYGHVFREGVLLLQKPLSPGQSARLEDWSRKGQERLISCSRLDLPQERCLFLLAGKASSGVVPPARAVFASPGALPPLPLPR